MVKTNIRKLQIWFEQKLEISLNPHDTHEKEKPPPKRSTPGENIMFLKMDHFVKENKFRSIHPQEGQTPEWLG